MDEETIEEATIITPKQIQDYVTAGINNLHNASMTYSQMVTKYKTSDWTKWPQTSSWYKALWNFKQAHDKAGICVFSDYGVSGFGK